MLSLMVKASKLKALSTRELFGSNVRIVRRLRDLSQEELAESAGIYRSHVTLIERGEINFSVDTMERVANALALEVRDLLDPQLVLESLRQNTSK
jgi:transcriptional regulator with XRE-family HTH domain